VGARGRFLSVLSGTFAAATLSGLACSGCATPLSNIPDRDECQVALAVPNMVCQDGCPLRVKSALANVSGVRGVDVDFSGRNALVDAAFPACSKSGVAQMIGQLHSKGYDASFVRMSGVPRLQ